MRSLLPTTALGLAAAALLAGCCCTPQTGDQITKSPFGTMPDGTPVDLYQLRNQNGVSASIINYGGIVVSLRVPDRNGNFGDVVLGHDTLEGYLKASPYFGCLVGRYGNRIARGRFTLQGQQYTLATNNYPNALHGGL
jgi:aldose 1-epimerase